MPCISIPQRLLPSNAGREQQPQGTATASALQDFSVSSSLTTRKVHTWKCVTPASRSNVFRVTNLTRCPWLWSGVDMRNELMKNMLLHFTEPLVGSRGGPPRTLVGAPLATPGRVLLVGCSAERVFLLMKRYASAYKVLEALPFHPLSLSA